MEHQIKDRNGAVVISFEGDVDLQSAPQAREALPECVSRHRPVRVDVTRANHLHRSRQDTRRDTSSPTSRTGRMTMLVLQSMPMLNKRSARLRP